MEYRRLGNTGLEVSHLCFGSLTIGPLQRKLPIKEGAKLIRGAFEAGINFIDTAQLYGTYPYIHAALKGWSEDVVIATKSYAYTADAMEAALHEALRALAVDVVPIVLLHEQESEHTIRGHWPALEYLLRAREAGKVRAVGISTHHVTGVLGACLYPEVEILSPLVNISGIGIQGGDLGQMLAAIKQAKACGKGIYAMKPLGGGHLVNSWLNALDFLTMNEDIDAIALGMKSFIELERNLAYFNHEVVEPWVMDTDRLLHIEQWCVRCGRCIDVCTANALTINKDQVVNDRSQCVFCGYCGAVCPEFAIKVI